MLKSPTMEKLRQLHLTGMVQALEEQENSKNYQKLGFDERLGHLVDLEMTVRENRKMSNRLRQAKFKEQANVEDVDFSPERGVDRSQVLKLAKCDWIKEHHNVIITGLTGVGKTYLACALAHKACLEGYSSLYIRIPKLFHEVETARADGRYGKILQNLAKVDVLILDDWGLNKLTSQEERDLLEIMEERYERRSTIMAAQVPVKNWHELIPNKTIADAILDRVVHNSYRMELKGDSRRKTKGKPKDNEKKVDQ